MSFDWLYDVSTKACGPGHWDNTPKSLFSRLFMPCWVLISAVAVVATHLRSNDSELAGFREGRSAGSPLNVADVRVHKRLWYLDYARIVAVFCIVSAHSGGTTYSDHNTLFVLHWVLPYLYMTSGTCFMLSTCPLWFYEVRLLALLMLGVAANWTADAITGRDWRGNFGDTVFQMSYVVALMVLSVLSEPLRRGFRWRRASASTSVSSAFGLLTICWALVTAFGLVAMLRGVPLIPDSLDHSSWWNATVKPLQENAAFGIATLGGMLFLCSLACCLGDSHLLGWILLAYIYVPRVLIPFSGAGFLQGVQLYFLGMVVECGRLKGSSSLREMLRTYWPLGLAVCLLLSTPDMTGRCDLNPPNTYWERFRFYSIEFAFTLLLLSGALETSDPYGATQWLGKWALYAYCFHVAWDRLFPRPWGAVISYSSVLLFYAGHRCSYQYRPFTSIEVDL